MSTHYNPSSITNGLVLCLDAANKKSYSVNVHPAPLDIHSWCAASSLVNCTITRDTSVTDSPAGGVPVRMTVTGNDPHISTYNEARWNLAPAAVGQTWTASVWAKGTTATSTAQLFMMEAASSGGYLNATAVTVVVGTSWQRVTASHTLANTSTAFVQVRLDGPDSAGTGTNIWWDGLQVERNASATAFSPLTNVNGTTWTNLANASINATLVNSPTFNTQGRLAFNGTTQSANTGFPGATTFTTDSDFTISCWARLSAYKPEAASIGTLVGALAYQGYGLYWSGSPTSYTFGTYMRYSSVTSGVTSAAVSLGTWYLVTQVYSRTGNFHQLYLNGTLSGSTTSISGTYNSNLTNVSISIAGGTAGVSDGTPGGGTSGTPFLGDISQVLIYNRALTAVEVTQNFNAMRGRFGI